MPTASPERHAKLLRELAEIMEAERQAELPPARPDLIEKWEGKTIHARRAVSLFGHVLARGDWLTITREMVEGSVDRKGHSVLDGLEDSDAIGLGQYLPEGEEIWESDDDPRKEMLRREEAAKLTKLGATPEQWRAFHRRFETQQQRQQREREEARRAATRVQDRT